MNIKGIAPVSITHKPIRIIDADTDLGNFTLQVAGTIKEIDHHFNFTITFVVSIEIYIHDKRISFEAESRYEVKLGERNVKFTSDNDFWDVASLIQVSISHARVLLMQELITHNIQLDLLRIDSLPDIYQKIKEGYFSLWN